MDNPSALPVAAIHNLFAWMGKRFGAKFANAHPGIEPEALVETWATELSTYTEAELRRGVKACQRLEWPPTLAEFQRYARPPINPEVAHAEAQVQMRNREYGREDTWSHPAIFYAAAEMGRDLFALSYTQCRARWTDALRRAEEGIDAGTLASTIQPRQLRLAAPGMATTSREAALQRIARLKAATPGIFVKTTTEEEQNV